MGRGSELIGLVRNFASSFAAFGVIYVCPLFAEAEMIVTKRVVLLRRDTKYKRATRDASHLEAAFNSAATRAFSSVEARLGAFCGHWRTRSDVINQLIDRFIAPINRETGGCVITGHK